MREDETTAQVNLLLNRAARLVEVESQLPHAGRVAIRNKGARRVAVRIPAWVSRRDLRCDVDGQPAEPAWMGNRVLFSDLAARATVTITFPVRETTARYTINANSDKEVAYTCTFRASTLVEISPKATDPRDYPLYERAHLRQEAAPTKPAARVVADRIARDW